MAVLEKSDDPLAVSRSKIVKAAFNRHHTAYIKVEKSAAILAGDNTNFVQASEGGVNVQAGVGKYISFQTMGNHGPFHMKMIWPLTMLCGPLAMPKDIPFPPFMPMLPTVGPFAAVCGALACWVAEELYGKNDIRTHHARLYTMVHDNFFTRLYRRNGIKWAATLKKHSWLKKIVRPIWDFMSFKGQVISKNYVFVKTGIRS